MASKVRIVSLKGGWIASKNLNYRAPSTSLLNIRFKRKRKDILLLLESNFLNFMTEIQIMCTLYSVSVVHFLQLASKFFIFSKK